MLGEDALVESISCGWLFSADRKKSIIVGQYDFLDTGDSGFGYSHTKGFVVVLKTINEIE